MKLSIVIVNYNVEYFLEQCLHSVFNALKNIEAEIFVVDNNSFDGSCEMVKKKFPSVHLIENKINLGFSKANNQAIHLSTGDYVLLLNPDTVVEENTFDKTIAFMDAHNDAGGLGVYMIDGKGNFLPESKRGLPTPWVAFYKIFGLSKIFPKSKRFNRYHAGHLSKNETNEIEILSGAFMLMRKKTLDKVGLLDEQFFMYGEDIDLSYRIIKGGYKNYYFSDTKIIHYKGESTKKSSVNYVFVFYQAMIIFAKKHFSQKHASTFAFLIKLAIYFRAGIAILNRFFTKLLLPLADAAFIFAGLKLIEYLYQKYTGIEWPTEITNYSFPIYISLWLGFTWFFGGYDKPFKPFSVLIGLLSSSIFILALYGLLPKYWQFSRSLVLLGALWSLTGILFSRLFLSLAGVKGFQFGGKYKKRIAIIGYLSECERVENILSQTNIKAEFIKRIYPSDIENTEGFVGNLSQLNELIHVYRLDEIIFCAQNNSAQNIMRYMSEVTSKNIEFKIAQPDSLFIIGSNSVNTSGDLYVLDVNAIDSKQNRRFKRANDLFFALILLIFSPILIFFQRNKPGFYTKLFRILAGKNSFVGYFQHESIKNLPKIKPGILKPVNQTVAIFNENTQERLNIIYARDFSIWKDIQIIINNLNKIS